jgi:energy-coupling factor transporter ATP-binding protein EcfA2
MRVGLVEIKNFRAIKSLLWAPEAGVNCLIGPGDSGKTTILDAVELVLSTRHTISFTDLDFYNGDHQQPIIITVTLVDLPAEFISNQNYGYYLRGFLTNQTLVDEPPLPEDGQAAISIRLTVDETLEGKWLLFNDRVSADRKEISLSYADRLQVAPARLGSYADRHLSWGRYSTLTKLSEGNAGTKDVLAKAGRLARNHFKTESAGLFQKSLDDVSRAANKVGMALPANLSAGLDVENLSITSGSIAIHGDDIPLRVMGLGSSRLLVAALQDHSKVSVCLTIIDEVEHGLEPYRISRLLKHLKSGERASPQVFITSHSPIVIRELKVGDLQVVRRSPDGSVKVRAANQKFAKRDPQAPPRSMPEAYLAPSILFCEGKTEVGLMRGMDDVWFENGFDSLALKGIALADGGGIDNAPALAGHFHMLGYDVGLLIDSDKDPDDTEILDKLKGRGIPVFRWRPGYATEDALFNDLPLEAVQVLFDYALELLGSPALLAAINKDIPVNEQFASADAVREELASDAVLGILASRAKGKKKKGKDGDEALHEAWFKDMEKADRIARTVLGPHLERAKPELKTTMAEIRAWIDDRF